MLTITLTLLASTANAADINDDGCKDSYFDANGACVSESASLGIGTTIGAGAGIGRLATLGDDIAVSSGAIIADRATVGGQGSLVGPFNIGTNSIVGRYAQIGADNQVGNDTTIGRQALTGARVQTGDNVSIGYATDIGSDVTIANGAVVGSLVDVGDHTDLLAGALLARGVQIADAATSADSTSIAGILGPAVTLGFNVSVLGGARVRKETTIGNNVTVGLNSRVGRNVTIEDNVTIGQGVRIAAGATIRSGVVLDDNAVVGSGDIVEPEAPADINPPGTLLIASSSFVDDSPPAGWTQCMGFVNTAGDDVSATAMNGCLPMTKLRMRIWNPSGTLIDDHFMSSFPTLSAWPVRAYVSGRNLGRSVVLSSLMPGSASFYATTNNSDACGQDVGGAPVHLATGNGNNAGIAPGHSNDTEELGRNCNGSGYVGYTVALYN